MKSPLFLLLVMSFAFTVEAKDVSLDCTLTVSAVIGWETMEDTPALRDKYRFGGVWRHSVDINFDEPWAKWSDFGQNKFVENPNDPAHTLSIQEESVRLGRDYGMTRSSLIVSRTDLSAVWVEVEKEGTLIARGPCKIVERKKVETLF